MNAHEIRIPSEREDFMHADRTAEDLVHMHGMLDRVRALFDQRDVVRAAAGAPRVFFVQFDENRRQRIVVNHPDPIERGDAMTVVGFFGLKTTLPAPAELDAMDTALLDEFPRHSHLAGYNTLELASGQHGNMVLFTDAAGIAQWRTSPIHQVATRDLSALIYSRVRIHTASLPANWRASCRITITRTRYYEFGIPSAPPDVTQRAYGPAGALGELTSVAHGT